MTRPVPFQFGRDFNSPVPQGGSSAAHLSVEEHNQLVANAEEAGFARGLAAGRDTALQSQTARIADSCERIARQTAEALSFLQDSQERQNADALELVVLLARKIASTALEQFPLPAIEAAAMECFTETRSNPHLVIRVAPDIVEAVEARLTALAAERGFAGRLIVLGEPEIFPGDARLEWADGGIVRDQSALLATVERAVQRHIAGSRTEETS